LDIISHSNALVKNKINFTIFVFQTVLILVMIL